MSQTAMQHSDTSALRPARSEAKRDPVSDSGDSRQNLIEKPSAELNKRIQSGSVLIIASRFPPHASVGATRVRKFVKYLREFGWRPVVLTGTIPEECDRADSPQQQDFESLGDLPCDVPIYRIEPGLVESPGAAGRVACKALSHLSRPFGMSEKWLSEKFAWRLDALLEKLTIPDRGVWRLHRAVATALRMHRRHRFKAIFSSGMPFSDHLTALCVRRLIARPWLADFRDPWVEYVHWDQWQTEWGRRATQHLESAVIRNAVRVISVNSHMSHRFAERYPRQPSNKFITIENGFDHVDFTQASSSRSGEFFRLVYAGSLYDTRRPDAMLAAFRRFLETTPNAGRFARFDFLGRPGPHLEQLSSFTFAGCVRYFGRVPHAEALRATAEADLNVVILPNLRGGLADSTAKVYECLGSGRPILAAVPLDGAAASLLRGFDGVSLCAPDDVDGIADAIRTWYGRWLVDDIAVKRSRESLRPLTRRHQAGQLARCLDEIALSPR